MVFGSTHNRGLLQPRLHEVRAEIAKLGHNLNILMHDKDWRVRKEVAKQGYGLLTLQNDANKEVSDTAKRLLKRGSC